LEEILQTFFEKFFIMFLQDCHQVY